MAEKSFTIQQHVFRKTYPPIRVDVFHENNLNRAILEAFLDTIINNRIGVAPAYGAKCALKTLGLSTNSCVLLIRFSTSDTGHKKKDKENSAAVGRKLLEDLVLCHLARKHAFKMDRLATALHYDTGLRITNGLDLLSLAKPTTDRHSLEALMEALGGQVTLDRERVDALFKHEESANANIHDTALQAWVACTAAACMSNELKNMPTVNTLQINKAHLNVLAKTQRDADRLIALKPTRVKNEVDSEYSYKKDKLVLVSNRFKTRVMRSGSGQSIEVQTTEQGNQAKVQGRVTKVSGRAASVSLQGPFRGKIHSVTTIGREPLTRADKSRGEIVLEALQRTSHVMGQYFVKRIWFPGEVAYPAEQSAPSMPISSQIPLNKSQKKAVSLILSNSHLDRVGLIHGPPGTGKTTVIAAAVTTLMASASHTQAVWLVAQSNVAVKNIAEKLAVVGFLDFKLLVSKDFHFEWHEHLYEKIKRNLIRSDEFTPSVVAAERFLCGSRVILCTLSMLSHDRLSPFMWIVPPQTIIVDEASQIEIGDYFPPLHRFKDVLVKLVFIGDDKQLAPYGQSDVSDLRSIFEVPHLRRNAIFLDTQYRMPIPLGTFISNHVYNKRLKSEHAVKALSSCSFINVATGKEAQSGFSWINTKEVDIAIRLAKVYQAWGKSYKIITPYDAQRNRLENALKAAKLSWEDRCFNVDSFQGNEADYIILSLVRSGKIGFLNETRRVNVMLTRCKKGMIILTSRTFVQGKASSSLVGKLAKTLGPGVWVEMERVMDGSFPPKIGN